MRFSIVIPTLNEEHCLGRCLKAICDGDQQPDEIIVADGMSSDKTRDIARSWKAAVLDNPVRHAAGGRNAGIAAATGDVVVFTDADARPKCSWLSEIKAAFAREPELQGVGGPVVAMPSRNHVEEFCGRVFLEEIMIFPQEELRIERRVFRGSFLTGNCAYKKDLLDTLGGFDEWFANHAEDIDLFWRAIDAQSTLRFLPHAVVEHPFPSTRWLMMKKNFRNGISSSKLSKRYGKLFQIDGYPYWLLLKNVVRLLAAQPDSILYCLQLTSHLLGKYVGSLRFRVINI